LALYCWKDHGVRGMGKLLIVSSKIREAAEGMSIASDFPEALSKEVETLIKQAAKRAKANGRKTVKAKDL
jgi:histone H3/H4